MTISFTDVCVFVTLALASGRVAFSITSDDLFADLRTYLMQRDFEKHLNDGPFDGKGFVYAAATCFYCLTFWTSLVAAVAWLALGSEVVLLAAPLALWAAANIVAAKAL